MKKVTLSSQSQQESEKTISPAEYCRKITTRMTGHRTREKNKSGKNKRKKQNE